MSTATLPIEQIRGDFISALQKGSPIIITAPTGSGKSTRVAQWMMDCPHTANGLIVVLQPRRLAARLLARRIAQERGTILGGEVGYQIRHDAARGSDTKLLFVTEGVLLRQMLSDPILSGVSAIVFDEFHERHLHTDIMLALANDLRRKGKSLRIVIMSATLELKQLQNYLPEAVVLQADGRNHPVACEFMQRPAPAGEALWDLVARELEKHHPTCSGHTLVFLPGAYEINRTLETVRASPAGRGCLLLPLHGELAQEAQEMALQPCSTRKIILTTNVAETSLTVEGVDLVIDSGLARIARYDPHRGLDTLWVEKISRAAAEQRAGRAGRTRPGRCVRLWTRADHDARPAAETPEVLRVDLAETLLALKALDYPHWRHFPWFEPPEEFAATRAEGLLRQLGAIDSNDALTTTGRCLLEFPAHPRLARLIIEGNRRSCLGQCILACALLQTRPVFVRARGLEVAEARDEMLGKAAESDFFALFRAVEYAQRKSFHPEACAKLGINANSVREVLRAYEQIKAVALSSGFAVDTTAPRDQEPFMKCLLGAFPDRIARRLDAGTLRARTVEGVTGVIDADSVVKNSDFFLACEIREIGQSRPAQKPAMRTAYVSQRQVRFSLNSAVRKEWLEEMFPEALKTERICRWDEAQRRLVVKTVTIFQGLVICEEEAGQPGLQESAEALAARVIDGTLALKHWDHRVENLLARLAWCAGRFPYLGLPVWDESQKRLVLEQLFFGCHSYKDVKEIDPLPVVLDWLGPHHLESVDKFAPSHALLPSGRRVRINYREDGVPVISARLQEFIGCEDTPVIGAAQVPCLIELLAPNMRPVQTTADLRGFWRNTYPAIRSELSRRYPKHAWPQV